MITKNITSKVHIKPAKEHSIALLRLKTALLAVVICLSVIFLIIYIISVNRGRTAVSVDAGNISYISVPITTNDTLWSIADKYYSDEFGTINDYVKEIKRCNSLKSDNIYAGRYIVVPVIYNVTDYTYNAAGA